MPSSVLSRGKVTDTRGPYEAGSIAVCRVGGLVALHIDTVCGRFIFHVREREWIEHARSERDHQGKKFRTLAEIEEDAGRTRESETPEPVVSRSSASPTSRVLPPSPASRVLLQKAWEFQVANLHIPSCDVAAEYGIRANAFRLWIHTHHHRELSQLRRAAGLSCRPTSRRARTA